MSETKTLYLDLVPTTQDSISSAVEKIEKDPRPYVHYFVRETGGLLKPEEFLDMLGKPEELVGLLSRPGEFIASAYDFAEHLLGSHRKFAVGMAEATKPLYGGTEGTAAEDDTK